MNRKETDIELIAKYYNGELDGKAMQQLEERALEDPFLADAMEGFSEFSLYKNDIVDLNERLKDRIKKGAEKEARPFGFTNWAIAASVVILIGFASIYLNIPKENKSIVATDLPENAAISGAKENESDDILDKDTLLGKQEIIDRSPVVVSLGEPSPVTNEVIASSNQILVQPVASSQPFADSVKSENVIAGLKSKSAEDFAENNMTIAARRSPAVLYKSAASPDQIVTGKVTDAENKTALPGVSVVNQETGTTVITDVNGEFKIPAGQETRLTLRSLGYQKKELDVFERDSLNVALKPDHSSLSEVVVVGYGSAAANGKQKAGPKDGWAAFRKYLDENDELESNEAGAVVVEFVINPNGTLSDFKILKSLSKLADARAIFLIRNYSSWQGSSDGAASKAKVTLRFR